MKVLQVLLIAIFPFSIYAQFLEIESASKIEAVEVLSFSPFADDEYNILFINHEDDLTIEDETTLHLDGFDWNVAGADSDGLFVFTNNSTLRSERGLAFDGLQHEEEPVILAFEFESLLFLDLDIDTILPFESEYESSIGIFSGTNLGDDDQTFYPSYIHGANNDAMQVKSTSETFIMANIYSDEIIYEDASGLLSTFTNIGETNLLLFSTDRFSNLMWSAPLDIGNFPIIKALEVADDVIYLLGSDADGTSLWTYDVEGVPIDEFFWEGTVFDDMEIYDGQLYLSGSTDTDAMTDFDFGDGQVVLASGNGQDGVILSYDENMSLRWIDNISGPQQSHISSFDISESGEIYTAGHIRGNTSVGGINLVAGDDNDDVFMGISSTVGGFTKAMKFDGSGNESVSHLHIADESNFDYELQMLMTFDAELDLIVDDEQVTLAHTNMNLEKSYLFLNMDSENFTSTQELDAGTIEVYPNPASTVLKVSVTDTEEVLQYRIYNVVGRLVDQAALSSTIDISRLHSGLYSLVIYHPEGRKACKFEKI